MKTYDELIRGTPAPDYCFDTRLERSLRIEVMIDRINQCRESGLTPEVWCVKNNKDIDTYYNCLKLVIAAGFEGELKGEKQMETKKNSKKYLVTEVETPKKKRTAKDDLMRQLHREYLPYIEMAKERQEYGYTADEICLIHGVNKSVYYRKLAEAREVGFGSEIPTYTGRWSRNKKKTPDVIRETPDDVKLVSVGTNVIKIARGDTTVTMPVETPQDTITKFVRALRAC